MTFSVQQNIEAQPATTVQLTKQTLVHPSSQQAYLESSLPGQVVNDTGTVEQQESRTVGQQDARAVGHQDTRAVGQKDSRTVGQQDSRTVYRDTSSPGSPQHYQQQQVGFSFIYEEIGHLYCILFFFFSFLFDERTNSQTFLELPHINVSISRNNSLALAPGVLHKILNFRRS